ncbi:MAG: 50S ribosomal protein L31e [Candidatus Bathyarchaeota archaeon]|nr:50S ribosomal protein L31e [Candidatus Bathyarchaeota archaeon]
MKMEDKEEVLEEVEEKTSENMTEEETKDEIEELLSEDSDEAIVEEKEEPEPISSKKKKKEKDEDIVEERIYTIPLGKALVRPPKKRAPRAISLIREFVTKHMKLDTSVLTEEEKGELPKLTISNAVNEKVWSRSIKKPPRKIRVRTTKDKEGNIKIFLAEGE